MYILKLESCINIFAADSVIMSVLVRFHASHVVLCSVCNIARNGRSRSSYVIVFGTNYYWKPV